MEGKFLGKIESVKFGRNSDRPFLFGLDLTFSFGGSGCGANYSVNMTKPNQYTHFTQEEQDKHLVETMTFIWELLKTAKVNDISQLKNIPVEVEIKGNMFKDFRILTEVL